MTPLHPRALLAASLLLVLVACAEESLPEPDAASDASVDAATPLDAAHDGGPECDGELIVCGSTCVDLQADPAHCGACDHACTGDERCSAGSCELVCRIDDDVHAASALDPSNPCQHCDPAVSTTAWTPLADGTDCGGGRLCSASVCAMQCVIAGTTYAAGAASPTNACEACDPSADPRAWTALADHTGCGAGRFCESNACTDGCVIGGAFYAPGSPNPATGCSTCVPATDPSAWTPVADGTACGAGSVCSAAVCRSGCFIGGAFHAAGTAEPGNACRGCDPAVSTTAWTPRADGTGCGAGSVCSAAVCRSGCFVGGTYYAAGALDPTNDCRACAAATSTTAWTTRPDRSVCGMAQYCSAATCVPTWHGSTPTGLTPIYGGSAAAGLDGRVFLFGAYAGAVSSAITQIYDPAAGTFTRGADAPYLPYRSCAVTAPGGRIFVIGGSPSGSAIANVSIYNPVTNTWAPGPAMPAAAYEHSCTLGSDGRIYVFAADDAAVPGDLYVTARTLILSPATGVWTTGAPMPSPRQRTTAVRLDDGRIAVTGGNRGYIFGELSTLNQIYTPSTNTWSTAAPMPVGLHWNVAALRADGRMVVTGGVNAVIAAVDHNTYVFDPATNAWATGTPVTDDHYAAYAARTPDGRIYVLTGRGFGTVMSSVVDALY